MKNLLKVFACSLLVGILFLFFKPNCLRAQTSDLAIGYSLAGELKTTFWNNGILCGSNFTAQPGPEGYYHQFQYLPAVSFILGIPGRDLQGTPYPWAMRPAVDSLSGQIYPDSIIYWGPTVSESWFDLTDGWQRTDWKSAANLFSGVYDGEFRDDLMNWISPNSQHLIISHSNRPGTWPNVWPGFWGWDENGQLEPGRFFSDEDIYWEMLDQSATRDVDPTQGYPTNIRVKAQASAFKELPGGIIFYRFRLINESPWNYRDIYCGIYFDADTYHRQKDGSTSGRSHDDDMMRLDLPHQLAMIWDLDDNSNGTTGLAYTGVGFAATPPAGRDIDLNADGQPDIFSGQPGGVTGWHWFDWYHRPGAWDYGTNGPYSGNGTTRVAVDKEAIQYKLMAGDTSSTDSPPYRHQYNRTHYFHPAPNGFLNPRFDSNSALIQNFPNGLDCVFILSTGPFNLDAGDSTEFVAVLLAADDSLTLSHNATVAKDLWERKYIHPKMNFISGNGGEVFSGNASLSWQTDPGYPYPVDQVDLWLGKGYDAEWQPLMLDVNNSGNATFNTADWPDGAFYRAMVVSHNGAGFVTGISESFFTIDNPAVNVAPDLKLLYPTFGDTLEGIVEAQILADDADGDSFTVKIEAKMEHNWAELFNGYPVNGIAQFDSRLLLNGKNRLRVSAADAQGNTTPPEEIWLFVNNQETLLPDSSLHHLSGVGNGRIELNVVDPSLINGHTYQITFAAGSPFPAKVTDLTTATTVLPQINYMNGISTNIFDGLVLKMQGFNPPRVDSTYWKVGSSDWQFLFSPTSNSNPADYQIEFGPANYDTVYNIPGTTPLFPVPFKVYNTTYAPQTPLVLRGLDTAPLGQLNTGDQIYLFEGIILGQPVNPPIRTYQLTVILPQGSISPQNGDIYRITTIGYFTEVDTIRFKSPEWLKIDSPPANITGSFELFQNYPNPFNPTTTIRFSLPVASRVKLEIYNLLGQKVRELANRQLSAGIHELVWDGRSDSGKAVASGVYIYRLTSGNGLVKSKKLLLIR